MGTWNMHVGRQDGEVLRQLRQLVDRHPVHALALQEAREYGQLLDRVPGYDSLGRADGLAWLVRRDVAHKAQRVVEFGGRPDGWWNANGTRHQPTIGLAITLGGWLRAINVHMPPDIDWPDGRPQGPRERVDDLVAAMTWLRQRSLNDPKAGSHLHDVAQRGRFGSDHPLVTFAVRRAGRRRGLCYVGDWNSRPGRDRGTYTPLWLAAEAQMALGIATGLEGALHGIDLPLVRRPGL